MRLLQLIASFDPAYGGPVEGLLRQDAACRAAGLDVIQEAATLDAPGAHPPVEHTIAVHALGRDRVAPAPPWRRFQDHWRYSPDFAPWLRDNVDRYDAVIVNGLWSYASFAASRVLPHGPTPYFVFPHGMMDPWFRRVAPLKHLAKQAFWLAGEGPLLAGARSVLFTSEAERRKARGQFLGCASYRETVAGYGATPPPAPSRALETAFRAAVPSLSDRPYLLFLGRLHPKKGCDLLISGFARVADAWPGIDLVMAGPDQIGWRRRLEDLAARQGVSTRIHWPGPLYGDAKWGALHGAEAFILPSHQENFGVALAEALGSGVSVLISDRIDIWQEIRNAGAGLVASDTVAGVEALVGQWLALPEARRMAMRSRARALFLSRFNVARTGPALIETIRAMI